MESSLGFGYWEEGRDSGKSRAYPSNCMSPQESHLPSALSQRVGELTGVSRVRRIQPGLGLSFPIHSGVLQSLPGSRKSEPGRNPATQFLSGKLSRLMPWVGTEFCRVTR